MPVESGQLAGFHDAPHTHPESRGWSGAATAIHAISRLSAPVTLHIHLGEDERVDIDFVHHAFAWNVELASFPADPVAVHLETRAVAADGTAAIELPGRTLDPLLWLIGYSAFGAAPAPWLEQGYRYRLRRWPNLADANVNLDQVRIIAMLGSTFATAQELAVAAHLHVGEVQRIINGFSTMGILRRTILEPPATVSATAVTPAPAPKPVPATSLFARLRERLMR